MIVYRVIEPYFKYRVDGSSRDEYQDYNQGIISTPSKDYFHGMNTHDYKTKVHYLHFFHYQEDAVEFVSSIPGLSYCGAYIAEYDIPEDLLKGCQGLGFYPNNLNGNIPVLEYAIPFDNLKNEFITGNVKEYEYSRDYCEEYQEYLSGGYQYFKKKYFG